MTGLEPAKQLGLTKGCTNSTINCHIKHFCTPDRSRPCTLYEQHRLRMSCLHSITRVLIKRRAEDPTPSRFNDLWFSRPAAPPMALLNSPYFNFIVPNPGLEPGHLSALVSKTSMSSFQQSGIFLIQLLSIFQHIFGQFLNRQK